MIEKLSVFEDSRSTIVSTINEVIDVINGLNNPLTDTFMKEKNEIITNYIKEKIDLENELECTQNEFNIAFYTLNTINDLIYNYNDICYSTRVISEVHAIVNKALNQINKIREKQNENI